LSIAVCAVGYTAGRCASAPEAIFGYAAEKVVGKSLDVIIPERFWRAHFAHDAYIACANEMESLLQKM